MSNNVVGLGTMTKLPLPVEKVLAEALKSHEVKPFDRVIVIGMYEEDSADEYFASSDPDAGTCLFDMERFKHELMKQADNNVSSS